MGTPMKKPDLFRYLDYRGYLRDWLAFRKAGQSRFSLRQFSKEAGLTAGYVSLVISGKRPLTAKSLGQLAAAMGLTERERDYLALLVEFGGARSADGKRQALERMKRFGRYQKRNPREAETHRYLTRWFNVVIREMCALPGFRCDPEWIQERLSTKLELPEIRKALEFLRSSGFIEVAEDGTARLPEKRIDCVDEVFKVGMATFHRQLLSIAADSIEYASRDERSILGHVFALSGENYARANEILRKAFDEVRALEDRESGPENVYALEVALFPVTKKPGRKRR